jgi:hypothetical protein
VHTPAVVGPRVWHRVTPLPPDVRSVRPCVYNQLVGWLLVLVVTIAALVAGIAFGCLAAARIDGREMRSADWSR